MRERVLDFRVRDIYIYIWFMVPYYNAVICVLCRQFTPLPVWHGRNYRSLGFRFGNVCYISDVSEIPDETYPLLRDCEILIMDALRPDRSSSTHFGLPKVLN
ncbi:putative ribonuclease Z/Hydroxyacylglutathione hydrolase [Helianthus annuus]|nr:putative ribonuclease Z/Hydroxyacylglutathione hydrolase [Helianthus annuus]KAJ0709669.1 putative ribonuclease Z/Hydroxyacylglutathione hydrolase [Helianthus annuus]